MTSFGTVLQKWELVLWQQCFEREVSKQPQTRYAVSSLPLVCLQTTWRILNDFTSGFSLEHASTVFGNMFLRMLCPAVVTFIFTHNFFTVWSKNIAQCICKLSVQTIKELWSPSSSTLATKFKLQYLWIFFFNSFQIWNIWKKLLYLDTSKDVCVCKYVYINI